MLNASVSVAVTHSPGMMVHGAMTRFMIDAMLVFRCLSEVFASWANTKLSTKAACRICCCCWCSVLTQPLTHGKNFSVPQCLTDVGGQGCRVLSYDLQFLKALGSETRDSRYSHR